ncbi:MAG: hypothetical protein MI785_21030 [Kiloniellales bacterium]|nr:hypothetical protein [Kiloniellales bacterium]
MARCDTIAEPLLAMESELKALQKAVSSSREDSDIEELGRRLDALELRISRTNARTPAGLAVKVRRLWENLDAEPEEWDLNNYRTLLESLESLEPGIDLPGKAQEA